MLVLMECDGEESKGEQGKEGKRQEQGKRLSAQKLIEKYYYQLTVGCGQVVVQTVTLVYVLTAPPPGGLFLRPLRHLHPPLRYLAASRGQ